MQLNSLFRSLLAAYACGASASCPHDACDQARRAAR